MGIPKKKGITMNTEHTNQIPQEKTVKQNSILKTVKKVLLRAAVLLLTTVLLLVGGIVGLVYTFNYGPSPSARSLFVSSVLETSAIGFPATWFLPSEDIRTILSNNTVEELNTVTNPNLIQIPDAEENPEYYEENDIEIKFNLST